MGIDFLMRTRQTIQKTIDRKRVALATPDLLTREPQDQGRCTIISLGEGSIAEVGDRLILEVRHSTLTARRDNTVVGASENASPDIVQGIAATGGTAGGIVTRVLKLSKKVEVAVC